MSGPKGKLIKFNKMLVARHALHDICFLPNLKMRKVSMITAKRMFG